MQLGMFLCGVGDVRLRVLIGRYFTPLYEVGSFWGLEQYRVI